MPEYLSPGVYVEEVPSGPRPIEGVGTSTTGIVALTERGPITPRLVTNWGEYRRWYGDVVAVATSFAPFARARLLRERRCTTVRRPRDSQRCRRPRNSIWRRPPPNFCASRRWGRAAWGNRLFVRVMAGSRTDNAGNPVGFRITVLYYRTRPESIRRSARSREHRQSESHRSGRHRGLRRPRLRIRSTATTCSRASTTTPR